MIQTYSIPVQNQNENVDLEMCIILYASLKFFG